MAAGNGKLHCVLQRKCIYKKRTLSLGYNGYRRAGVLQPSSP